MKLFFTLVTAFIKSFTNLVSTVTATANGLRKTPVFFTKSTLPTIGNTHEQASKPAFFVFGKLFPKAVMLLGMVMVIGSSWGQAISFSGATYTQDFQSLTATNLTPASIANTTMLQVSAQSGGGSVNGWYIYHQASGTPRWGRSDGSSSTGSFFAMYDAQTTPGRALGSQGSSNIVSFFGTVLQNTSGSTINSITISYDAVMNRNPATTVNTFPMSYRVSSTSIATASTSGDGTYNDAAGTWTAGTGFSTPSTGTGSPNSTQVEYSPLLKIGSTVTQTITGLNWGNNQYLYFRWKETDEAGADATGGVDNFSFKSNSPAINPASTTLTLFSTTYGTTSTAQTVSITGSNLTANLVATAPTGFEVSSNGTTFGSTATFTQSSGNASGTLSIRLAAAATVSGSYNSQNIVLSSTGATSVNIATASSGNIVSAKALTIIGLTANNKIYNGLTTATLSGTPAYSGLVNGQTFTVTGTAAASFATASFGTAKTVTVSGYTAPSTNYTVSQPTGLTANITAAPLTITGIAANNKIYDGTTIATLTGTPAYVGLQNSESFSVVGTSSASFANADAGNAKPVTVLGYIAPNTNYFVSQPTGLTANIMQASVTIIPTAGQSKIYGAADPTFTYAASPSVTITGALSRVAGEDVGTYANAIGTLSAGSNYALSLDATNAFAITPAALTITGVSANNKAFDGNTTANLSGTAAYVGLLNGDVFNVTGTPVANFNDATVGTAKPVTVTGYTAPSANYTVSQPAGLTADITAACSNPTISLSGTTTICNGQSTSLSAIGADTYLWSANAGAATTAAVTVSPTITTTYTVTGTVAGGCTGTASITVTVNQPTTNTTTVTACDTYTWVAPLGNGTTYTTGGTYTNTSTNAAGCAHTETLVLTINNSTSSTQTVTACDTYIWTVNGQTYTTGGSYIFTGTNAAGCTDTKTLVLTINNSTSSTQTVTSCDTYTWSVNGQTYTTSGTYIFTGTNAAGCTDTKTLVLTINNSTSSTQTVTACDTYSWLVNGQTYTTSGSYIFTGTNAAGCTDTKTLLLTINNSTSSTQTVTACDTYTWSVNGQTYTTSGSYTFTGTNSAGCTDIKTLVLTITPGSINSTTVSACNSYTWANNGVTYSTSGVYTGTTTNCATEQLNLTINTVAVSASATNVTCNGAANGTITATASTGAVITVNGAALANPYGPGTYTIVATAPNTGGTGNCTATTTVIITEPALPTITVTSNGGGTVSPSGIATLTCGASQTYTFTANAESQLAAVIVDGTNNTSAVTAGTYTFNNVTANHTLVVNFTSQNIVESDPALVDVNITNTAGTLIDANQIIFSSVNKLNVPILNFSLATDVPSGTIKVKIDLGTKLTLDNTATFTTGLPTEFTWTQSIVSGHQIIIGDQIAILPVDYDAVATLDVKATSAGTSLATGDILITNHNNASDFLVDAIIANNHSQLQYTVLSNFTAEVQAATNVNCFGGNNGSITILATGGATPYSYSKDGGTSYQTSPVFNNLIAGTYSIIAKDNLGQLVTVSYIITQPIAVTVNATSTNVSCFGAADGTITATGSAGTTITVNGQPYVAGATYAPGTYTIVATAPNGNNNGFCTATTTVTITQPIAVTVNATSTNVSCFGAADGTITATGSAGTTITVNGNPYVAGATYVPGTYTIVATAPNGNNNGVCTATTTVTITQPIAVTVNATSTNVSCFGAADGTITATGSAGTTITVNGNPYVVGATYVPGTYTIVATAPNGNNNGVCTATTMVTITQPIAVTVNATSTNVSCFGAADGTITATGSAGTTIIVNGQPYVAGATYAPGTYTIVATAPNGNNNGVCTATTTVTITQPIAVTVNATSTNVSCFGAADGTITATGSAGTTITVNGQPYVAGATYVPGTYTIVATAPNGNNDGFCTATTTVTITQPIAVTVNATSTNVSCFGAADGTITATGSAGTTITVNGQPYVVGATYVPGTYTIVATAPNGNNNGVCTATTTVTITQPIAVTVSATSTNVSCFGAADGTITATGSAGTTITVNGNPYVVGATYAPGTYTIVATAPNGNNNGVCTATTTVTITQPIAVTVSATSTNVSCFGAADGTITATGSAGTTITVNGQPYVTGATYVPGTYTIVATAPNGNNDGFCTATTTVTITQPIAVTVNATSTNVSCFGAADGTITATGSAGTTITVNGNPYIAGATYVPGTYTIVATAPNGNNNGFCTATTTVTITQPIAVTVSATSTNVSCFGAADGTITATGSAGTTITVNGNPYVAGATYAPGTYTIVATAPNGNNNGFCTATTTVTITQPIAVTVSATSTNVSCFGAADGTITATGSTGSTITVNGAALANPYGPGSYTVTATAPNGNGNGFCTKDTIVIITQPIAVTVIATSTNVSCFGAADGTITATGSAGTTITVNGNPYLSGATYVPGTYTIVATAPNGDNNGFCTATTTVTITQPIAVTVNATSTNVSCFGAADGTITATGSAGTTITVNGNPYVVGATYVPGTYTIVATAPNGNNNGVCTATTMVTITQPIAVTVSATSTNVSCFGAADGTITATGSAGTTITVNGNPYVAGATYVPGTYTIVATAPNGNNNGVCTATTTVTITQPIAVTVNATSTNVSCFGAADGTITATGSAGTTITVNGNPYVVGATYVPGTYTIVATAPNGNNNGVCAATTTVTITQPIAVTVNATSTNVSCFGAADGTITATGSAGTSITVNGNPYLAGATYVPGTYTIVATALNGNADGFCTATTTVTITQPIAVTVNATSTNVSCFGAADGTITATGSAGTTITVNGNPYAAGATYAPGTYTIVATAPNGTNNGVCTATTTVTITQPIAVTVNATSTNVSCFGAADGTITATGSAGTTITVNGQPYVAGATYAPGTYTIVATAPNGNNNGFCTATTTVTITQPIAVTVNATSTNVSCFGAADGTITATGSAGTTITVNGQPYVAGATYAPGTYTIVATAPNGNNNGFCTATTTVTITQPIAVTVNATSTNVSCFGAADGTITATGSAGTTITVNGQPYVAGATYAPGTYTIVATAPNGNNNGFCTATTTVTITQPIAVTVNATSTNVSCFGAADGTITATGSAGTTITVNGNPYLAGATYAPGTYTIVATAPNGNNNGVCTATTTVTITQPIAVTVSATSTNVSCFGAADGTITATGSAGTTIIVNGQPYVAGATYGPGTYIIVASAPNGNGNGFCTATTSVTITQPTQMNATVTSTNAACAGNYNSATITIASPTGGSGSYQYSINGGITWQSTGTYNVNAGIYNVQIRDADNISCVRVLNPALVITEAANTDVSIGSIASDNLFGAVNEIKTIMYNLSELNGKAATPSILRIFKPSGYQVLFSSGLASYTDLNALPAPVTYTLDNSNWVLTNTTSSYVEYSRTGTVAADNTIGCNQQYRVAFSLKRTTVNISKFNLNTQFRPSSGEIKLNNNTNSIIFTGE